MLKNKVMLGIFLTILLTIVLSCSTSANDLSIEVDGPYLLAENSSIEIDNVSSSGVDKWNWGIVDNATFSSGDFEGRIKLEDGLTKEPTFHAPEITTDSFFEAHLWVDVLGSDGDGSSVEDHTKITIINALDARPGRPYQVPEGESIVLDKDESSGKDKEYHWGIKNDSPDMNLTHTLTPEPVFYAPHVEEDKEITIILELTSSDNRYGKDLYRNVSPKIKPYDRASTTVKVLDTSLSVSANNVITEAGSQVKLEDPGEGYVTDYKWEIIDDPTGKAFLENEDTATPIFHPPNSVPENTNIAVQVTVSNEWRAATDNMTVLVTTVPPQEPKKLRVEGRENPQNLNTLKPTFRANYSCANPYFSAEKIEIVVKREEKVWSGKKSLEVTETGNSVKMKYGGKMLVPEVDYTWEVRFKNSFGWGPWGHGEFSTGGLLSINKKEARNYISSNAFSESTAKKVESALDENIEKTIDIVENVSAFKLADLLTKIAQLPSSPAHSAIILREISENKAIETVRAMIGFKYYTELDNIFAQSELPESRLNNIYNEVIKKIPKKSRKPFKQALSPETKGRLSAFGRGVSFYLIIGIFAAIIVVLVFYRKRVEDMLSKVENLLSGGKEESKKWKKIVLSFAKSKKDTIALRSNLPPERIAAKAQKAIKALGKEDEVRLGKKNDQICLVKK
ncbi:hypothetical protein AKJ51_02305 [candidate division MSBL1 archaeon SCGC-AAA382A20]|uniref:PKD/Chitinase domain-containing protein n=1 Tax=candidate division MSBL1 archaeon SCGC-AAA382A20 TaxID=1698280 RepID=A0A133VKN0_9EURY|nr:hypothetical protein AKJ51_02305 [candidate division MSBL1 archaeon SCGC-AAA382A20]